MFNKLIDATSLFEHCFYFTFLLLSCQNGILVAKLIKQFWFFYTVFVASAGCSLPRINHLHFIICIIVFFNILCTSDVFSDRPATNIMVKIKMILMLNSFRQFPFVNFLLFHYLQFIFFCRVCHAFFFPNVAFNTKLCAVECFTLAWKNCYKRKRIQNKRTIIDVSMVCFLTYCSVSWPFSVIVLFITL